MNSINVLPFFKKPNAFHKKLKGSNLKLRQESNFKLFIPEAIKLKINILPGKL